MKKIKEKTERYEIRDGFFYTIMENDGIYEAFIGLKQPENGLLYGRMHGCDGSGTDDDLPAVLSYLDLDAETNIMLFLSDNLELAETNPELFPVLLGSDWEYDEEIYRFVRYTDKGREILDINTLEWEEEESPVAAFRRECGEIADRLSAEGKPSWGADYELQVEDLRRWYKEQYPDVF